MKFLKIKFLALALMVLCSSSTASAYSLSCGEAIAIFQYGDDTEQMLAVGHLFGTVDMVATMLCFGRDRRCNCLSNAVLNRTDALADAYVDQVSVCRPGDPVVGAEFNAALQVCR